MSIYVSTISEQAKKNGVPTSEYIANLREAGFELPANAAHLKKLTAEDLVSISKLLNPGQEPEAPVRTEDFVAPECASLCITKISDNEFIVSAIQSSVVNGNLVVKELERRVGFRSKAEALLESDRVSYLFKCDRT